MIQLYSWALERLSCYVAQVDLELTVAYAVLRIMAILLPQHRMESQAGATAACANMFNGSLFKFVLFRYTIVVSVSTTNIWVHMDIQEVRNHLWEVNEKRRQCLNKGLSISK